MKKGFTLVEIIVALMIFSIVSVVALAALVRIMDANKKAQTISDAVTSMSFTIESMTRELRTGSEYYCRVLAPNTDLSVSSLSAQSVSQCSGVNGNSGNGVGFAFLTNRTATNAGGCRLINAYEMVPNMVSGSWDGTFAFKKATQTSCNQNLVFTPVIDTAAVALTNYFLQVRDAEYPLLFFKFDGNAGKREAIKTYFSIQTAASPRLP